MFKASSDLFPPWLNMFLAWLNVFNLSWHAHSFSWKVSSLMSYVPSIIWHVPSLTWQVPFNSNYFHIDLTFAPCWLDMFQPWKTGYDRYQSLMKNKVPAWPKNYSSLNFQDICMIMVFLKTWNIAWTYWGPKNRINEQFVKNICFDWEKKPKMALFSDLKNV